MKTLVHIALFVGAVILTASFNPQASTAQAATKPATQASSASYTYTAQPGDTYTQLVRKAVQTYGLQEKKNIGKARIIAIETKVASERQNPELSTGQNVSFSKTDVKKWVDEAMKLSAGDIATWNTYVPFIDFDTRAVGEARK